jgi:hypothetical protein
MNCNLVGSRIEHNDELRELPANDIEQNVNSLQNMKDHEFECNWGF